MVDTIFPQIIKLISLFLPFFSSLKHTHIQSFLTSVRFCKIQANLKETCWVVKVNKLAARNCLLLVKKCSTRQELCMSYLKKKKRYFRKMCLMAFDVSISIVYTCKQTQQQTTSLIPYIVSSAHKEIKQRTLRGQFAV